METITEITPLLLASHLNEAQMLLKGSQGGKLYIAESALREVEEYVLCKNQLSLHPSLDKRRGRFNVCFYI